MKRILSCLLALVLAVPGVAQNNLPDLGESSQAGFSPANERKLGEMVMRDLRRDPVFLDDPEIQAYVESLGQRLVQAAGESKQAFDFFVMRDISINAFAMPGGFIGVHSGLILAAQSESEIASVLGHEIAHVTQRHIARQLDRQGQVQMAAIAALIVALLAARSNPDVASAAIVTSQAGAIQSALNYSRDLEREADRLGFQYLQAAGFDVSGTVSFFERLQRTTRLQDFSAPAYLRSHPLTTERIADMQNRVADARYRQHADSPQLQLVRTKLRALNGTPREAVGYFETQIAEKRYASEGHARYGLALALHRAGESSRAAGELATARKLLPAHTMLDTLDAGIRIALKQGASAVDLLAKARQGAQGSYPVSYAYVEALQATGRHVEALATLDELMRQRPRDGRVWELQAKSFAETGKRTLQHRSQAEFYYLRGALPAAIEQLMIAQSAGDADFYTLSAIDARMRFLKAEWQEERKQRGLR